MQLAVICYFEYTCHTFKHVSTSGLGGYIAISGCVSMSRLFVDAFFEFAVVKYFVIAARITVILQRHSAV